MKTLPTTEFPDIEAPLPSDLTLLGRPRSTPSVMRPSHTKSRLDLHQRDIGSFGRQAQAVCLLDQVLHVINLPCGYNDKLAELDRLDGELQSLLRLLMDRKYCARGVTCAAISILMRYSVLLNIRV